MTCPHSVVQSLCSGTQRRGRSGRWSELVVPDPERVTPPAIAWVTAVLLLVLATLAYGTAGSLKLPEFSNPAGQLSRVLFFAVD